MKPIKIIQAGIPRSGNILLNYIFKNLLEAKNMPCLSSIPEREASSISRYLKLGFTNQAFIEWVDINRFDVRRRVSTACKFPVSNWEKYLERVTLVATHSYLSNLAANFFRLFDFRFYIIRDPRDILVSRSKYDFTRYMRSYYPNGYKNSEEYLDQRLEELVGRWVYHISSYLLMKDELNLQLVRYEDLLRRREEMFSRIAATLGLSLSRRETEHLCSVTEVESMKKMGFRGHIWKGKSNSWSSFLTDEQNERVINVGGGLMSNLGYNGNGVACDFDEGNLIFGKLKNEFLEEEAKRTERYVLSLRTYDSSIQNYM